MEEQLRRLTEQVTTLTEMQQETMRQVAELHRLMFPPPVKKRTRNEELDLIAAKYKTDFAKRQAKKNS